MTTPSRVGSPNYFSFGSSSNSGSQAVTIPAGCNLALVSARGWNGSALNMASLTLGGTAMDLKVNLTESGDSDATVYASLKNPGTGSKTLAWDWSGSSAISDGAEWTVEFFQDADTSGDPVRDSGGYRSGVAGSTTNGPTIGSASDDFVTAVVGAYGANPDSAPSGAGQTTDADNQNFNNVHLDIAHKNTPGSSTTQMQGTASYLTVVAISLKASGGGGGGISIPVVQNYRQMMEMR